VAAFPIGSEKKSPSKRATAFFQAYLAFPIVLVFWFMGYLWKQEGWLRTSQIDVDTGRREVDWDSFNKEAERVARLGPLQRARHILF
jgi:yeast amino acid transporter